MEFKTQVSQHADNTYSLSINLDHGFMSPDDLLVIADLAKKHNVTKMMCTTAKKISFYNTPEEEVNGLWDDLLEAFGDRLRTPKGKVIVCPGKGVCKFAMEGFDGHKMADDIIAISKAHNAGKIKAAVSTCPRRCSSTQVRDIGVFAAGKGWTVTFGGNGGTKPSAGEVVATGLSYDEAVALVDKLYAYIEEKKDGNERTARLLARLGMDDLKAYIAE